MPSSQPQQAAPGIQPQGGLDAGPATGQDAVISAAAAFARLSRWLQMAAAAATAGPQVQQEQQQGHEQDRGADLAGGAGGFPGQGVVDAPRDTLAAGARAAQAGGAATGGPPLPAPTPEAGGQGPAVSTGHQQAVAAEQTAQAVPDGANGTAAAAEVAAVGGTAAAGDDAGAAAGASGLAGLSFRLQPLGPRRTRVAAQAAAPSRGSPAPAAATAPAGAAAVAPAVVAAGTPSPAVAAASMVAPRPLAGAAISPAQGGVGGASVISEGGGGLRLQPAARVRPQKGVAAGGTSSRAGAGSLEPGLASVGEQQQAALTANQVCRCSPYPKTVGCAFAACTRAITALGCIPRMASGARNSGHSHIPR